MGIIITRITRARERYHAHSHTQRDFRPQRGTNTALLQYIDALEHAEKVRTPLFTSRWEIRCAFDSVSRETMELSWLRLMSVNIVKCLRWR